MPNKITLDLHKSEGMYLYFPDRALLDLSQERVRRLADEYWHDPAKLPPRIKQSQAFKTCDVCPFEGQEVLCSAVKPLLPFLDEMDKFRSYDKVNAVYMKREGLASVSETTMQNALQYVTNMAIFEYCEDAKRYRLYFQGIEPFMDMGEARSRLFLNIYWLTKGDREKRNAVIEEIRHSVTVTSKNCVERLNLLCKSDAFVNAYVKTHTLAQALAVLDSEPALEDYFRGKDGECAGR